MSSAPSVLGLVLNYNGLEVTRDTLRSLQAVDYPRFDLAMIDNGSSDGSWQAIGNEFPAVTRIRVAENRGISWGLNHGIRWGLEHGYDYLLLMNNDIEVAEDFLTRLVEVAESDPKIGCVGPKSYYWAEPERLWSTGGILRFRESVTRERGDGEIDRGQYDRDEEVPYVNGCAMLVKRRAQVETGLWDPAYYLGVEDADWCVRMKQKGWRCWYAHRARLWHRISHSIGVYKPTRTFHTGRSSAIFLRKYATPLQWARAVAALLAAVPVAWLRELRSGNQSAATAKARGFLAGLGVALEPIPEPPSEFEVVPGEGVELQST